MRRTLAAVVLVMALGVPAAFAQSPTDVRIDISRGQGSRIRIYCESLKPAGDRGSSTWSVQADEVLAHDLDWSAVFAVTRAWTASGEPFDVQAVIGGTLTVKGNQLRLNGEVKDFPARRVILVKEYRGSVGDWRSMVHQFADDIVLQFTGESGVSQTRIVFDVQEGRNKELYVMDYDGARLTQLSRDQSIALSPAWSPEGSLLLFTSYRGGGGPRIYVSSLTQWKPYVISARKGNNTSASYSPDGKQIACTLSQDGNAEIYLLDARGGSPQRLTNSRGIDTSPAWSPPGERWRSPRTAPACRRFTSWTRRAAMCGVSPTTWTTPIRRHGLPRATGSPSWPRPAAASTSIPASRTAARRAWW
jgi:TolB protein